MLELEDINVNLGDFSLKDISFTVGRGDYFILLGVSGAGKSMLLETIAGLVKPVSGSVLLDGKEITREKIQNRNIGLVFQDHAVFPHLSVIENMMYALHGSGLTHYQKKEKAELIAGELNIFDLLQRRPDTLSGGELQRVALGRTLIQEPKVLLLDEPLASMDIRLKGELRKLLRAIHRKGQTILHVTHDYEEALSLATKIAVINEGTIIQEGTPSEVFHHPGSEFVAHFVGVKNFFPVKLVMENDSPYAMADNKIGICIVTDERGGEGFAMIRGEDVFLSTEPVDTSAVNNFPGKITEIVPSVSGMDVTIDIGIEIHALVTAGSFSRMDLQEGKECWVHFKATAVKFIRL
jgi:molybdate/tungstate transport system ATP-binding protein